jgi:hypothetical protein
MADIKYKISLVNLKIKEHFEDQDADRKPILNGHFRNLI